MMRGSLVYRAQLGICLRKIFRTRINSHHKTENEKSPDITEPPRPHRRVRAPRAARSRVVGQVRAAQHRGARNHDLDHQGRLRGDGTAPTVSTTELPLSCGHAVQASAIGVGVFGSLGPALQEQRVPVPHSISGRRTPCLESRPGSRHGKV